uniref:Uncharacterized protein n=1 Tax=Myoviridae sp. ctCo31 TaxID=2825053 RepID=A0A8S5UMH2_9CAUD|nr:MAG TPA: hypothetical protein [Myoviridae sp. ctCo31]
MLYSLIYSFNAFCQISQLPFNTVENVFSYVKSFCIVSLLVPVSSV